MVLLLGFMNYYRDKTDFFHRKDAKTRKSAKNYVVEIELFASLYLGYIILK